MRNAQPRTMLRSIALLALARAARPPIKLGRRAALSLLTPMPANAMWQLWLPSDMERFVAEADANADSVLASMDRCAETSWMMNMGSAKGDLIEKVIQQRRPKRLLEIGTFLGYMSIRLATSDTVGHVSEDDQGDYPFQFSPALPWRYTTSGFHATSGGYVDQLKFSVGVTSGGNAKVRMSSISGINGALGDMGQNYKNLAFLAAGLGWDPPTVAFGCGHR